MKKNNIEYCIVLTIDGGVDLSGDRELAACFL